MENNPNNAPANSPEATPTYTQTPIPQEPKQPTQVAFTETQTAGSGGGKSNTGLIAVFC